MTGEDPRSVGELLLDADLLARRLLIDASGDQARALARTWESVVNAAAALWASIPNPSPGAVAPDTMSRLEAMAGQMRSGSRHRSRERDWPGPGPFDGRLDQIAATFTRASDLIRRSDHQVDLSRRVVIDDVLAARMRIMHTLYVASHAIGLALHEHLGDLHADAQVKTLNRADRQPQGVGRTRERIARIAAVEQVAGSYVGQRFAAAVEGEAVWHSPWGVDRLSEALAAWDIQVRRTLAGGYSARDLVESAQTQADIVSASAVLLNAATRVGHVEPSAFHTRLRPALEGSHGAWTATRGRWSDLLGPGIRGDGKLFSAAAEVRAAVRELAYDKTTWATPDVIAGRADLEDVSLSIQLALGAAIDVAGLLKEIAIDDSTLRGPARAIGVRLRADVNAGLVPGQIEASVSPNAIHANRLIGIAAIRRQLITSCDLAVVSSTDAMGVAACLDRQPLTGLPDIPDPWSPRGTPGESRPRDPPVVPPHRSVRPCP